jgi:hypothetical protein
MPGQPIPPSSPAEALAGKQLTPRMLRILAAAADEAERRSHSFDAAATETRQIMDSEGYNRPQSRGPRRAGGADRRTPSLAG